MVENPYDDGYTQTNCKIIGERLSKDLLANHKPSQNPIGIMLGGQPASGKTTLIQHIKKNVYPSENLFVINGDEYRAFHPHYHRIATEQGTNAANFTQAFANKLVSKLKKTCLDNNVSFIIEGTLRTFQAPKSTTEELLSQGFSAELHVLSVNYEESLFGVFNRYEKSVALSGKGRFSPLASHDEAYRAIPINCKAFLNKFTDKSTTLHLYKRVENGLEGKMVANIQSVEKSFKDREQPSISKAELLNSWLDVLNMANTREGADYKYLNFIENKILQFKD